MSLNNSNNLRNWLAYHVFWGAMASGLLLVLLTVSFAELHSQLARLLVLLGAGLVLLPLLAAQIAFSFQQRKEQETRMLARQSQRSPDFWAPPVLLTGGDGLSSPRV